MVKNKFSSKWFRIFLPTLFIVSWLAMAAFGTQYFSKLGDLSSMDVNSFLPKNAESSAVNTQLEKFSGKRSIPAIIVFEDDGKLLSPEDVQKINTASQALSDVNGVIDEISPPVVSEDGLAAFVVAPLKVDGDFKIMVPALKQNLDDANLSVSYALTGPAMFSYTLQNAFSGIDSTLLIVAISVVFLILIVVYRSPFLPFIVMTSALTALSAVVLVVYYLAQENIVQMNGQVQGILFILVIGAATDYSLLYIARYREELIDNKSSWQATLAALKSSYAAILAAGCTVAAGLMCMLLSDLASNQALGPTASVGVLLAVLATLSFLPALLLVFGRRAFWPKMPKHSPGKTHSNYVKNHPVWAKVGGIVKKHPRRIWTGTMLLLLVACIAAPQLRAEGVAQSDLVIGKSEGRDGQKLLDAHFPPGSGSPAIVIANYDKQSEVVNALDNDKGVSSVTITVSGLDAEVMPIGKSTDDLNPAIKPFFEAQRDENIKIVDGNVMLRAVLNDPADSFEARDTISRLRDKLAQIDDNSLVGGQSAAQLDTNQSSLRDLRVIIPAILAAITIILMVLLRAIVAPLILLATTVLSFGATMGVSAILFNDILNFPGADPAVIIFSFVFLVALGIDYNIFLMSRVREETIKSGVATGTIKGLVVTGGVITSAGIVLAATFASLGVIPLLFLVQIAFIVAFGVLVDTIIVRSLLVPAITLEIGRKIWWPSQLAHSKK